MNKILSFKYVINIKIINEILYIYLYQAFKI